MKTTLDLPDDLLMEAKTVAARRKTTLRAIVESALRRELHPGPEAERMEPDMFEAGPYGILRLKRAAGETISLDEIESIGRELDDEEFKRTINPRRA